MRRLIAVALAVLLVVAGTASYRAAQPVHAVELVLAGDTVDLETRLSVETRSSGFRPVEIALQLTQGGRSYTLAKGRVRASAWSLWREKPVSHRISMSLGETRIPSLRPGPAVLRATARGARLWLWQPSPVVAEREVRLESVGEPVEEGGPRPARPDSR